MRLILGVFLVALLLYGATSDAARKPGRLVIRPAPCRADIWPGRAGSLCFKAFNGYRKTLRLRSVAPMRTRANRHLARCHVRVSRRRGLGVRLKARRWTTVRLPRVVRMGVQAPQRCEGRRLTIRVRVTASR